MRLVLSDATQSSVDPLDPSRAYKPQRQWLHTVDDVRKYLAARKLKIHPGAIDWLHKLVNCPGRGGFGALNTVVLTAQRAYPELEVLTLVELLQAHRRFTPHREQKLIAQQMQSLRPAAAAG